MEQVITDIASMDKVDAVLKIVVILLLGVLAFFFGKWKIKQAAKETEIKKKEDIEDMQTNNQSEEIKTDSQASDDFFKEEK